MIMAPQAMTLTDYGKPASPPSHSPWKTLRVSHRLTASTTSFSPLTSYRGTHEWPPRSLGSTRSGRHFLDPSLFFFIFIIGETLRFRAEEDLMVLAVGPRKGLTL